MKIVVKKSSIHGLGIFARVPIRKGETVAIIKGVKHHKINKTIDDVFMHPDWIGFQENFWIDPKPPYKYWNHSCDPNTGIRGRFLITALRDIKAGEEITTDYSIIEPDPRWVLPWKCACGSRRCRKKVRALPFLPEKLFNKYSPYIPTAFKKMYAQRYTQ